MTFLNNEVWGKYHKSHLAIYKLQRQLLQNSTVDTVLSQAFRKFSKMQNKYVGHVHYPPIEAEDPPFFHSGTMTGTIRQVLIPPDHELDTRIHDAISAFITADNASIELRKIHLADLDRRFFDAPIRAYNDSLRSCMASVRSLDF